MDVIFQNIEGVPVTGTSPSTFGAVCGGGGGDGEHSWKNSCNIAFNSELMDSNVGGLNSVITRIP